MIENEYCTVEQAKLLKKKGFPQDVSTDLLYYCLHDELIYSYYELDDVKENLNAQSIEYDGFDDIFIVCPTFSLVMKWLRDEKNIYIEPWVNSEGTICYTINSAGEETLSDNVYNTWEDAVSEGINKSLELLL